MGRLPEGTALPVVVDHHPDCQQSTHHKDDVPDHASSATMTLRMRTVLATVRTRAEILQSRELDEAVLRSRSIKEALQYLGLEPKASNYVALRTEATRRGICLLKFRNGRMISDPNLLLTKGSHGGQWLKNRLIKLGVFERKCYGCGLTEWMAKPIPLELHHHDGDDFNNVRENVTLLCPNCHTFTPNYRNRGKPRSIKNKR